MESRSPLLFRCFPGLIRASSKINSFEYLDHVQHLHRKSGLFLQFAFSSLDQSFAQLQRPSGNGPLTEQWLASSPDQQRATIFNHHSADSHDRFVRILPPRTHSGPLSLPLRNNMFLRCYTLTQQFCINTLTSGFAVYNTTVGGGREFRKAPPRELGFQGWFYKP